jgi:hypothetical protein
LAAVSETPFLLIITLSLVLQKGGIVLSEISGGSGRLGPDEKLFLTISPLIF